MVTKLLNMLSLIGFGFITLGLVLITEEKHYPGSWALLPTLGAAFIILSGEQAWFNRNILSNSILIWFGLISFPLYLWHWPLLFFAGAFEGDKPGFKWRILIVMFSCLLAWLTYKFIEKPIRLSANSKVIITALFFLMGTLGSVGYYCYINEGLGFRFPKVVRELTKYKYDVKNDYREFTCFLEPDQNYKQFHDCGITRDSTKKTILIWGDSHAAHLYPGYRAKFQKNFNIIQRTASACPPILGMNVPSRKYCKKINDDTFELIKKEKPDMIVLSAFWFRYPDYQKISYTIHELNKVAHTTIVLVGP